MDKKRKEFRCPDPDCEGGKIIVYNAYSKTPLIGEEQDCEFCRELDLVLVEEDGEIN